MAVRIKKKDVINANNIKKIEVIIKNTSHIKNELTNKNGDTFLIKSEEFDDFILGCKIIEGNQKQVFSKEDMLNFSQYVYNNWVCGQTIDKIFLEWSVKYCGNTIVNCCTAN